MCKFIRTYKENYSVFEKHDFSLDKDLIIEMKDILKPSYINPDSLIDRVIQQYDYILFSRNKEGILTSFFTTNFDKIDNEIICNLGLLAVRDAYKRSDLIFPVVFRQIELLRQKQKEVGKRILCWCTTASTSIFKATHFFYDDCQPRQNGSYDIEGLQTFEKIVKGYKIECNSSTPFVLRQYAHNTQYSQIEKERISKIVLKKKNLFDNFQINESNGDRLVIVSYPPSDEKFNYLSRKIKTST